MRGPSGDRTAAPGAGGRRPVAAVTASPRTVAPRPLTEPPAARAAAPPPALSSAARADPRSARAAIPHPPSIRRTVHVITLSLAEIATIVGGQSHDIPDPTAHVTGPVVIDSRQVADGSLFAAFAA